MKRSIKTLSLKQILLFLFYLHLATTVSIAQGKEQVQNELFTLIADTDLAKVAPARSDKYSQLKRSRIYKNIFAVKVGKLAKIQRNGVLKFNIPGSAEEVTIVAKKVDAQNDDDFYWYGTSENQRNTALFNSEKGRLSGSFNVGDRYFQLSSLEVGVGAIIEEVPINGLACGSTGAPLDPHSVEPYVIPKQDENARAGVCTEPIRVLILYTQQAATHTLDIVQLANGAVGQYNQAIDNVGRSIPQTNKIAVAGIQPITFTSNDPESTTNSADAASWVNSNSTVQSMRNTYNADLVICFIFKNQSHAGWAAQIPANNAQFSAIVRVEATPIWTFAHELGHLLGGRHHDDSNAPQYSHGYSFTGTDNVLYQDIMYNGTAGTRINYFSAPNVNYAGVPVGTYANNDVARRISEVSTSVVNLRPSTTQPFNAAIIGPTSISSAGYYDWELYTFCRNFLTTTWQFSTDGFNYGSSVGFGDMVSFHYVDGNNNGTLYLRCTITTDQNQTYVTTSTINVNICSGCRETSEKKDLPEQRAPLVNAIFPNPASTKITVDYSLTEKADVDLQLIDLVGRPHIARKLGEMEAGEYKHEISTGNLANGMYVCRIKINGVAINRLITITR
ncbi:MAG: hypothetical protein BGO21_07320 [Dyadobacter sp. 50-39]|uniref:M12 family metallo-peptidase n=1 Tax=Dyadobacter sp. 50-39 TaxID=1895756 RepID=UPI00096670A6|nr:M12 family metallo-peptidase [Dyadobacter sp. 50-39]OJV17183.1 MAG: hypothetical protein BGO21_07320 [Dyadobacter sp. 50-39]